MYPTIVVIIVHCKSPTEETCNISALMASSEIVFRDVEARPSTVGHLSFAVPPSTTGSVGGEGLSGPTNDGVCQGRRVVL